MNLGKNKKHHPAGYEQLLKYLDRLCQASCLEKVWFYGHCLFLVHVCLYLLGAGGGNDSSSFWSGFVAVWSSEAIYRRGCYCLVASYWIVVYKKYLVGGKQEPEYSRMISDSDVLYFGMAMWMTFSDKFSVMCLVMGIYSFYHVAGHLNTSKTYSSNATKLLFKNQAFMLDVCSHFEVFACLILVFRVLCGTTSLLSFLVFAQFIRLQYSNSSRTRRAFAEWHSELTRWSSHPSCPSIVLSGYKWMSSNLAKLSTTL